MPLGPLIVILFNTLDRVIDSKRLLWMYRRPVANIAENIGMYSYTMVRGRVVTYCLTFIISFCEFSGYAVNLWKVCIEHNCGWIEIC